MKSMTGYARASHQAEGFHLTGSLSSVNSKSLNLKMRLPDAAAANEIAVRKLIQSRISRGSVTLTVEVFWHNQAGVVIDRDKLSAFLDDCEAALGSRPENISLQDLAAIPELLVAPREDSGDTLTASLLEMVAVLLNDFNDMRQQEADALMEPMTEQLLKMRQLVIDIREGAGPMVVGHVQRLKERVSALIEGRSDIDDQDVAREIAILGDKLDITEELDRLDAHLPAFEKTMAGERVGKKLDFILQEMNRETNTIGSKCADIKITQQVIEMKTCVESLREQVQNLE